MESILITSKGKRIELPSNRILNQVNKMPEVDGLILV